MIDAWQETATKTGAKIVSLCGSDCIPWDLSVMAMEEELPDGEALKRVVFIDDMVGAASGGTIATMLLGIEEGNRDEPKVDPYMVLPDGKVSDLTYKFSPPLVPTTFKEPGHHYNEPVGFFFLSLINAAFVKRSVVLRAKSKDLVYEEYALLPNLTTGISQLIGLTVGAVMLMNPLTGYFAKKVLPNPGEGPTMDQMQNKFYGAITGYGEGTSGTKVETIIYFPRDQGYLDTARMVTESALCMALDGHKLPTPNGGFWTPSTGMGNALLERLQATGTYFAVKTTKK